MRNKLEWVVCVCVRPTDAQRTAVNDYCAIVYVYMHTYMWVYMHICASGRYKGTPSSRFAISTKYTSSLRSAISDDSNFISI